MNSSMTYETMPIQLQGSPCSDLLHVSDSGPEPQQNKHHGVQTGPQYAEEYA